MITMITMKERKELARIAVKAMVKDSAHIETADSIISDLRDHAKEYGKEHTINMMLTAWACYDYCKHPNARECMKVLKTWLA
jgi:hypothetical protein